MKNKYAKKQNINEIAEPYRDGSFRCACCEQMTPRKGAYSMRYTARTKTPDGCGSMSVCPSCAKKAVKLKIDTISKLEKILFGNAKVVIF